MEPWCRKINKHVTTGLTVLACVCSAAPALADSASRTLPVLYEPSVLMNVSIEIVTSSGAVVVGIEDVPPTGWTNVTNISDGGTYDSSNQKVKWPPFFDNLSRTVSYDITPPGTADGAECFNGIVSFDGNELSIVGDKCIDVPVMVPATSTVSLIVMVLLLIAAATIILRRDAPRKRINF